MCPTGSVFYMTTRNVHVAENVHSGVHVLNGMRFHEMQSGTELSTCRYHRPTEWHNIWLKLWGTLQNRMHACTHQYLVNPPVLLKSNLMQYAKIRDFPADNSVSFTCKYHIDVSLNFEISDVSISPYCIRGHAPCFWLPPTDSTYLLHGAQSFLWS